MSLDVYLKGAPCECCEGDKGTVFSANITHNLTGMADAAGIYEACWRPEEIGIAKAADLVEPLSKGLELLISDPDRFRQYDSPNGWGLYDNFVLWVAKYLEACRCHPDAMVETCR